MAQHDRLSPVPLAGFFLATPSVGCPVLTKRGRLVRYFGGWDQAQTAKSPGRGMAVTREEAERITDKVLRSLRDEMPKAAPAELAAAFFERMRSNVEFT